MASSIRPFRSASPVMASNFFTCKACANSLRPHSSLVRFLPGNQSQSIRRITLRAQGHQKKLNTPVQIPTNPPKVSSPPLKTATRKITSQTLGSAEALSGQGGARTTHPLKTSFFPATTSPTVGYWLLGSAASVFGIVVFGGLTRLTESGLSITDWRPVTGTLPPLSADDWHAEFAKYRSSPEFARLNPNMELSQFKKIYWMEWTHRLWGRLVGLTFVLPTVYFIARGRVSARTAAALVGISGLIGFQGVLGWWMVKSGLRDDLFAAGSHPRVSQYRLAAHLGTAFTCYSAMLLAGLRVLRENRWLRAPHDAQRTIEQLRSPRLRFFRRGVTGLALLVFTTVMSGAFVAGLDAGLIYNEFPYMGNGLAPPRAELFDSFYSRAPDGSDLVWRNALENPSLVQLDHRILATTTFTAVMALWAYARFGKAVRTALTPAAKSGVRAVAYLAWMQVLLGISTLLYLVPTPLAATHQAGSLALLTGVLVLRSRLAVPARTAELVAKRLAAGPAVSSGMRSVGSMGMGKRAFGTFSPLQK